MLHSCDICSESKAVEVPYARLYTGDKPLHICKGCGFVYVQERRSPHEVANDWSSLCFGTHYTALIPAVKARLLYVADFIQSEVGLAEKRVLDLGAGEGYLAELMRERYGAVPFCVEPSEANCARMEDLKISSFRGTVEDYSCQLEHHESAYDIATITWTLENCVNPVFMLETARRSLKHDGYLVVATGSRILVPFKKPLQLYLSSQAQDLHSFRFSANTLTGILNKAGFTAVKFNRFLDSDILAVIASPQAPSNLDWKGDDFIKIHNFFERWHFESLHYR